MARIEKIRINEYKETAIIINLGIIVAAFIGVFLWHGLLVHVAKIMNISVNDDYIGYFSMLCGFVFYELTSYVMVMKYLTNEDYLGFKWTMIDENIEKARGGKKIGGDKFDRELFNLHKDHSLSGRRIDHPR